MDEKVKELLEKMKELGMTETDVIKTLSENAKEKEDEPVNVEEFQKTYDKIRRLIKKVVYEIYAMKNDKLSEEVIIKDLITATEFKQEYRELAIVENTRIVTFANNIVLKLSCIEKNIELQEAFYNLMISSEDVVYGNIILFKDIPLEKLYDFAKATGSARSAAYDTIKECIKKDKIEELNTQEDIENAKVDMKNLVATIFRVRFGSSLDDKYIKEFIRLINLKKFIFDNIKTDDDMFIAYGTTLAMLLVSGVLRVRTILRIGLEELKKEIESLENEELLALIGVLEK
ncbi:MAG: hypothetical protein ACRCTZ_02360 [Sarcina sp.]